jgi:hypothetical protein
MFCVDVSERDMFEVFKNGSHIKNTDELNSLHESRLAYAFVHPGCLGMDIIR